MQYALNYSGTRFCPLKIKINQFPGGFRLNKHTQPTTACVSHVLVHSFSSLDDYEVKLPVPPFMKYVNTQPKPFFLLLTLDTSLEIQFQEK